MKEKLNYLIEKYRDRIIEKTQEIIRIRSVIEEPMAGKPFGEGIDKALKFCLNLGEEEGLNSLNIDGFAGFLEVGQGEKMAGILCHVDVVPEGTGWSFPPYNGDIHKGKLFGRGSIDNKGPAIASLFALKAIKESGLPVQKRGRLILGTDEESGAKCIQHYLKKEEPPICGFSPDAEFPGIFAEKGIIRFKMIQKFSKEKEGDLILKNITGGTRANVVPEFAECNFEIGQNGLPKAKEMVENFPNTKGIECLIRGNHLIIKSQGTSAHASLPEEGENAIGKLFKILAKIDFSPRDAFNFVSFLSEKIGIETNGDSLGIKISDEVSGKLTLNLGVADFDENMGQVQLDIRYPVSFYEDKIMGIIRKQTSKRKILIADKKHKAPVYVDKESKLIKTLQSVYSEMTGEDATFKAIGGGTYCRYLDNTVAFGPVFPGQKELAHQKDEFISIEDLILITKIYAQALYLLIK